jgi:hypothetical protein
MRASRKRIALDDREDDSFSGVADLFDTTIRLDTAAAYKRVK